MSDEHEPLWSDERIAKFTHTTYVVADVVAIIPIELMRNLITAVRDDYEPRIAELEAQLAQTWQPLPDGEYDMGVENEPLYVFGNTDPDVCTHVEWQGETVMLDLGMTVCRLVERAEPQPTIPPDVREAIRKLADYGMPLGATNTDWRRWRDTTLTWLDEQNKNE